MSKNLLAGLFILLASGVATWLFFPAVNAPAVETAPQLAVPLVAIGPLQLNVFLIVLFVAGGVPFMAVVMALLVSRLSRLTTQATAAPTAAATPARKPAPAAPAAAAPEPVAERTLPTQERLAWLVLGLVAVGVTVFLALQFLPPGFTLF